jgi:hypothetical protein
MFFPFKLTLWGSKRGYKEALCIERPKTMRRVCIQISIPTLESQETEPGAVLLQRTKEDFGHHGNHHNWVDGCVSDSNVR